MRRVEERARLEQIQIVSLVQLRVHELHEVVDEVDHFACFHDGVLARVAAVQQVLPHLLEGGPVDVAREAGLQLGVVANSAAEGLAPKLLVEVGGVRDKFVLVKSWLDRGGC